MKAWVCAMPFFPLVLVSAETRGKAKYIILRARHEANYHRAKFTHIPMRREKRFDEWAREHPNEYGMPNQVVGYSDTAILCEFIDE